MQLHQKLGTDFTGGEGILDPTVIEEVSEDVWPDPRDADELHDALLTLIRMPANPGWGSFYEELAAAGRVSIITRADRSFWVAAERNGVSDDPDAVVAGWLESIGPITAPRASGQNCFRCRAR